MWRVSKERPNNRTYSAVFGFLLFFPSFLAPVSYTPTYTYVLTRVEFQSFFPFRMSLYSYTCNPFLPKRRRHGWYVPPKFNKQKKNTLLPKWQKGLKNWGSEEWKRKWKVDKKKDKGILQKNFPLFSRKIILSALWEKSFSTLAQCRQLQSPN